jgi:hypothetical protein
VFISHSKLKDRLCKIDGNSSSIHVGLLTIERPDPHAYDDQSATVAQKDGGVHPIIQADWPTASRLSQA